MELNYLDNSQLESNQETYSFEDAQIELEDGKTIILEGVFDVTFSKEDDSFDHDFGTEVCEPYHKVDEVNATIILIKDEESNKITLSDEEYLSCICLIEENIQNQDVESI